MPKKDIVVEEKYQNIREDYFQENIQFDPKHLQRFFTSNVIRRTISHSFVWTGKLWVRQKGTSAGAIVTAPIGTGFEHNDRYTGNAPDAYGTAIAFDSIASRVDLWIWDKAALIKRSVDGVLFEDEIELSADSFYSFDCSTHSINIKNKTGGQTARYQIVGWY